MKYSVVLQSSEEGYSVSCPGLPGCWSQGQTEEQALENIRDAIREYLEAVKKLSEKRKCGRSKYLSNSCPSCPASTI
jgi:predicted RNase H-like HicB family nuclease